MTSSPFQSSTIGTVRRAGDQSLERSDSGWGNTGAFAAISRNGQVVVWGDPAKGGQLDGATAPLLSKQTGVPWIWTVELAASSGAFAARRANGQVVAWGDNAAGGTIPADLAAALRDGVVRVFGLGNGFAALKADGRLITWGPGPGTGQSSTDLDLSKPYKVVTSFDSLAILQNGRLVGCWGGTAGASQWAQHAELRSALNSGVLELVCNDAGFAARTATGQVITWGAPAGIGDASGVSITNRPDIVKLGSEKYEFHGFDDKGQIWIWRGFSQYPWEDTQYVAGSGPLNWPLALPGPITGAHRFFNVSGGGMGWSFKDDSILLYQVSDSTNYQGTITTSEPVLSGHGLAVISKGNKSVETFGYELNLNSPNSNGFFSTSSKPSDATWQAVRATSSAFAALASDGHVGLWGDAAKGATPANPALTQELLQQHLPQALYSNQGAFVALAADGTAISWGQTGTGGDANGVPQIFSNIDHIVSPWANVRIDEQGPATQYNLIINGQANPEGQTIPLLVQEGDQLSVVIQNDPNGDRVDTTGNVYTWQRNGQASGDNKQASINLDALSTGAWSVTPTYLDLPGFSRTLAPLNVQVRMVDNGQASVSIRPVEFTGPSDQAFSAGNRKVSKLVATIAGDPEGIKSIDAVQWFRNDTPIKSDGTPARSILAVEEPGSYSFNASYTDTQGYQRTVKSGRVQIAPAGGVPSQSHLATGGLQTLWRLAGDGRTVERFDSSSLRMRPVNMAGEPGYLAISASSDGRAWTLTNNGVACVYDDASNRFIRLDGSKQGDANQPDTTLPDLGRGWRQIVAARGSTTAPSLWLLGDIPQEGGSNVAFLPGVPAPGQTLADLKPVSVYGAPALRLLAVGDDQTPWGIDTDGNLWRWDATSSSFGPLPLAVGVGGKIRQLQMVDQGQVWALDDQGVLQMWNGEKQQFTPVPLDSPFWTRRNPQLTPGVTPTWESFALSPQGGFVGIPRTGVTMPGGGSGLVTFDTSEIRMLRDPSETISQLQLISGETLQDNGVRQVGQNLAFNLNNQVNVAYMLSDSKPGEWEGAAVVPKAQSGANLSLEPGPNRDAKGTRLPVLKLSWLSGLGEEGRQAYGSRGFVSPFGGLVFEEAAQLPPAGALQGAANAPSGLPLLSTRSDAAISTGNNEADQQNTYQKDIGYTTRVPIEWNTELAWIHPDIEGKKIKRSDSWVTKFTDLSRLFVSSDANDWKKKNIIRIRLGGYSQPNERDQYQVRGEYRYELTRNYGDKPANVKFVRVKPDFKRYDPNTGEEDSVPGPWKTYSRFGRNRDTIGSDGGITQFEPLLKQYGFFIYGQLDFRFSVQDGGELLKSSLAVGVESRFIIPVRAWLKGSLQFSLTIGATVDAYGLYQKEKTRAAVSEFGGANAGVANPFSSFISFVDSRDQTPATSQTPQQYLQALIDPEQIPGSSALSSLEEATPAVDFISDVVVPIARTILAIVLPGGDSTATPERLSTSSAEALLLAISNVSKEQPESSSPTFLPSRDGALTAETATSVSAEAGADKTTWKAGIRFRPYVGGLLKLQTWVLDGSLHTRVIPYFTFLFDDIGNSGHFKVSIEKTIVRMDLEFALLSFLTIRERLNLEIPGAKANAQQLVNTTASLADGLPESDEEPKSWLESTGVPVRSLNTHTTANDTAVLTPAAHLVSPDGTVIGIITRLLPGNTGLIELCWVTGRQHADGLTTDWDAASLQRIEGSAGLTVNIRLIALPSGRLAVSASHLDAADPLLQPITQLPPGTLYRLRFDQVAPGETTVLDGSIAQKGLPSDRIWAQLGSSLASSSRLRSDWIGDSLIAGASGSNHGAGAIYIINGLAVSSLDDLSILEDNSRAGQGGWGLVILGSHKSGSLSGLGQQVINGGDTNADGFNEIFASAPHDQSGAGLVYMLYGGKALELLPQVATGSITLDTLDALQTNPNTRNQFLQSFTGVSGTSAYGTILAGGVDLNGDGHADPLIGYAATNTSAGSVELWSSRRALQQQNVLGLDHTGQQAIPHFDRSLLVSARTAVASQSDFHIYGAASVGDLNGDGHGDIVLSSDSRAALVFGDALMPVYWEASSVLGSIAAASAPDTASPLSQTWTTGWVDGAGTRVVLSFAGADRNNDGRISTVSLEGATAEVDWLALRRDGDPSDPQASLVALSPQIAQHWSGALQISAADLSFDLATQSLRAPVSISADQIDGDAAFNWSSDEAGLSLEQGARRLNARLLSSNAPGVLNAAGIGDFNGDGRPDLALSQAGVRVPNSEGTALVRRSGQTAVVFGSPTLSSRSGPLPLEAVTAVGGLAGLLLGDSGGELSAIGDWNRDGKADLLIREPAAPGASGTDQAGSNVALFGRGDSSPTLQLTSELQAGRAQILQGSASGSLTGASAAAGDFEGGGKRSLLIGAPNTIRESDLRQAAAGVRVLTATQNADGSWQSPQQLPSFSGAASGQQQLSSYTAVGNRILATWVHARASASGEGTDELWAAFQDPSTGTWTPAHKLQSNRRGDPTSPSIGEVQALALGDANGQATGGVLLVWTTLDPITGRTFLFQSTYNQELPEEAHRWSTPAQQDPDALLLANQDAISGSQLKLQLNPGSPEQRSQIWAEASISHEGQAAATINLRRSGDLSESVALSYRTRDRSASAGSQYMHSSGSVSFAAGEHSAVVVIPLIDNKQLEHRTTEFVVDFSLDDLQAQSAQLLLGNTPIASASGTPVLSVGAQIKDNDVIQMRAIDAGISLAGPLTGTTGAAATASTAGSATSETDLNYTIALVGDPGANAGLGQAYAVFVAATGGSAANPGMDWKELNDINWLDQSTDAKQGDKRQLNVLIQQEEALAALDPRAGFGTAMVKLSISNKIFFAISAPGNPLDGTRPSRIYVVSAKTIQNWADHYQANPKKPLILSDSNALVIEQTSGGLFGSVLTAADLDDDGNDELIIGAPGAQTVTVIAGSRLVQIGRKGVSDLSGHVLTDVSTESTGFGSAIAALDFDRNGALDLAIGAPKANPVYSGVDFAGSKEVVANAGAVHVIWGENSLDLFNGSVTNANKTSFKGYGLTNDRGSEDDPPRPASEGLPPPGSFGFGEELGSALAAVDLNGDNHKDLVIGAPQFTPDGTLRTGRVVTLFAAQSKSWSVNLSDKIDRTQGVSFVGQQGGGRIGASLASAGDLQSDHHDDLAIGAPFDAGGSGRVYVAFGSSNRYSKEALEITGSSFQLDSTSPNSPFQTFEAPDGYQLGQSVVGLGDVNNDSSTGIGGADLFLGSPAAVFGKEIKDQKNGDITIEPAGQTHMAWGRPWLGPNQSLDVPFAQGVGFLLPFGGVPQALGDLNGDGYGDYALLGSSHDWLYSDPTQEADATKLRIRLGAAVEYEQQQLLLTRFDLKPAGTPLASDQVPLVVAGDFDGDAFGDLIAYTQAGLQLLPGAPNLSVQADAKTQWETAGTSVPLNSSDPISQLASGDFDGDGYDDLVVVTQKPTLANANPTISIHWGSGSGLQFGGQKQLQSSGRREAKTYAVDSLIALDSNGDGVDELALYGNGLAQFWPIRQSETLGWGVQMLGLRKGADPFGKAIQYLPIETGPKGTPTALSSGDMNGDGFADLLIDHGGNKIDVLTGNRKAYLGSASVSFTREQTSPTLDIQRTQLARFIGDVNADGRDDILFSPTSASPRTATKSNSQLYESFKRGPYSYVYTGSKTTSNNILQIPVPKFWDQEDNNTIAIADRVSKWNRYGFAIESLPGEATPYRTGSIGDVNGDGLEEVMFSSNQLYVGDQAPPAEQRPHTIAIYGSNRSSSEAPNTTTSNDGTDFDDTLHQLGSAGKQELLVRGKAGSDLLQVHADPYGATVSIPDSGSNAGRLTVSASNGTTLWSAARNPYELVLKDAQLQIFRTSDGTVVKTWGGGNREIDRVYLAANGWLYFLKAGVNDEQFKNPTGWSDLGSPDQDWLTSSKGVLGLAGWFENDITTAFEVPTQVWDSQLVFSPSTGALYLVNRQSKARNGDSDKDNWSFDALNGNFEDRVSPRSASITLYGGDPAASKDSATIATQLLKPGESLFNATGAQKLEIAKPVPSMDDLQILRRDLLTFVGNPDARALPFGILRSTAAQHDRSLADIFGGTTMATAKDDIAWAAQTVQKDGPYVVAMDGNGRLTINAQQLVEGQIKPGSELAVLHEGNPDPFLPPIGSEPVLLRPGFKSDQITQGDAGSRTTNNEFSAVLKGGLDDDRLGIDVGRPERIGLIDGGPGIDTLFFSSQRNDGSGNTIDLVGLGSRIRNIEAIEIPTGNTLNFDEALLLNTPLHRLKLESRGNANVTFQVREEYLYIGDQIDAGLTYSVYAKPNANLQLWVQMGRVGLNQELYKFADDRSLQPMVTRTSFTDADGDRRTFVINSSGGAFTKERPARLLNTSSVVNPNSSSFESVSKNAIDLAPRSIDFAATVIEGASTNVAIDLAALVDDDDIPQGRRMVYYAIASDGGLSPLTYSPRKGGGARLYDLDGNGRPDFMSLRLTDGGPGDKDGVVNGVIDDPSTAGSLELNPVFSRVGSQTLTAADPVKSGAPASLVLRASLTARTAGVNQIGYVVLEPGELANADALLADLTALRGRAQLLFYSLESRDVVLPTTTAFTREFLLVNGQSVRFFQITDATLEDLSSATDPRLQFFSTGDLGSNATSLALSSAAGVRFNLGLLNADQGLNALIGQEQGLAPVLDFTAFSAGQRLLGTLVMGREAALDSVIGLYRVVDIQGTVRDQNGNLLRPGDLGYKDAALLSQNRVDALTGLTLADNQTSSRAIELSESAYLAPFMQVQNHTFFAFADANTDRYSHFKILGTNLFGAEDLFGGGDGDHDDRVFGFSFSQIANLGA